MLDAFNKLLNPLSMYKGVSIGLTGVWGMAFIFSFLGIIAYEPLEMLAALGALGTTVWLASLLCGWLFGVRTHSESSYITALILSLIFSPTLELKGLLALALVGLVAGASKFVLAYKGRHIFNPAAVGAFIVSLTGLAFASWWVATPPLTPFVIALGLIALYKTRRLGVAGVFLAIAVPVLFAVLLAQGNTLTQSAVLLLSWPIFFLAGVMLCEPLTLPPRKWQQYLEAGVVGLLFALPLHFGLLEMTPALALLVGNLLAFVLARRSAIHLTLKKRHALTPSTDELVFKPSKPVRYEAGQYMEITVHHPRKDLRGLRRSFSLTSAPGAKDVTFGVKFYTPSSSFKKALRELKPGTEISATTVGGDFVLPKDRAEPLLYIAGGIGITPFISHLQYLMARKEQRDITLLYAVSSGEEVAFKDVLIASGVKVLIVTAGEVGELPTGWAHVNEPFLTEAVLKKSVADVADRTGYVSGPPALVSSAKRSLKHLGVRKVKTDYFVGY